MARTAEEKKAYMAIYRKANKERILAQQRAYKEVYYANPESKEKAYAATERCRLVRQSAKVAAREEYARINADEIATAAVVRACIRLEKGRASRRNYSRAHADENKARAKAFYERNKEYAYAKSKAWKAANPHKVAAGVNARRGKLSEATPAWADSEFEEFAVLEAYLLRSTREAATGIKWQVDHCIPLTHPKVCGLHCSANLQVIPATLNSKKNNKFNPADPDAWLWPHGSAFQ